MWPPPTESIAMQKTYFSVVSICLLSTWLGITPLDAQDITGRITGRVFDQQNTLVPGAGVTATHLETNTIYTAMSGATGQFSIPAARLGSYRVIVEATGFKRALVANVVVETGGTADVNITLEVGGVQDEVAVTVDSAQEVVNTVDAEIGAVIDRERILQLPLNGRNASHLALFQAGVFFERSADGQGDKLIIHGQRHRSLAVTLDGIDTQDNLNRASSVMLDQPLLELSAEHVQEFRVVTGIASAEFSRGGSHISAVTKGGSNDWHGGVFSFHRNDVFNANDFFNNATGVARPKLIRNQFGGSLSGPIFKDRTFFYAGYEQLRESMGIGVNRTVWTAEARQGIFRYLDGSRNTPENVARNPNLIRSANLFACGPQVQSVFARSCLDSRFNQATPLTLDPLVGSQLLPALPLPNNFEIGDGLNTGGFRFNASTLTFLHKPSLRIDHRLNERHSFNLTFNYNDRNIVGDFINDREARFPGLAPLGERLTLSRAFSVSVTSLLGSAVNEFRAGFISGENAFYRNQPFGVPFTLDFDDITDPFEPGGGDSARLNKTVNIRDTISWLSGAHQFKAGFEWRQRSVDNRSLAGLEPFGEIDFNDDDNPPGFTSAELARFSGGTSINATDLNNGEELLNNLIGAIGNVEMTFNATTLQSGFVPGAIERRKYRDRELDWFIQDSWNLHPRLTLNLGVRWEFQTVPDETQGLTLIPEGGFDAVYGISGREGFFNPGKLSGKPCPLLTQPPRPARSTANSRSLITDCAVRFIPGGSTNGQRFYKNDWNNFAPVLSLAWDLTGDGRTSLRTGFRTSYQQDVFAIIDGNVDDNEGLQVFQTCVPLAGDCSNRTMLLRDVVGSAQPTVPVAPRFELPSVRTILDGTAVDFRTFEEGLGTPYYSEWTFGIQREIMGNWALDARYVGNRGVGLRRVADFNEINVGAVDPVTGTSFVDSFKIAQRNLACNRANGAGTRFDTLTFGCSVANPLMDALIAGEPARLRNLGVLTDALDFNQTGEFVYRMTQRDTSAPAAGQARIQGGSFWGAVLDGRLPANFFQANPFIHSSRAMVRDGSSTFHAFELELRRRFQSGFSLQTNYTYEKAISDFDGDANELLNDTRPSSIRFKNSTRGEFMPRHLFKANWIYDLPVGPDRRFKPGAKVINQVLGGWQMGGLISWRTGRPLSITSGSGTLHRSAVSADNTVTLSQPLDRARLRNLTGRRDIASGVFFFDPCLSSQLSASCTDSNAVDGLFQLPAPGEIGQLGQSVIFGPGSFNFDFNLSKRTALTERFNIEFRWEVFNAFNNVTFGNPATDVFSASFGQISSAVSNPRLMQFALKLAF
jgi:hypothetical protein